MGIPVVGIPIPLAGTIQTPEIAFYKTARQTGVAKFIINAYETSTGKQLFAVGPISGILIIITDKVLFVVSFRTTDIPEKKRKWWSQL